jgi:hypothetical protein
MLINFIKQLAGTSGASPEEAEPLTIGGVPLLWSQEPLHLLLAGSMATGKGAWGPGVPSPWLSAGPCGSAPARR